MFKSHWKVLCFCYSASKNSAVPCRADRPVISCCRRCWLELKENTLYCFISPHSPSITNALGTDWWERQADSTGNLLSGPFTDTNLSQLGPFHWDQIGAGWRLSFDHLKAASEKLEVSQVSRLHCWVDKPILISLAPWFLNMLSKEKNSSRYRWT